MKTDKDINTTNQLIRVIRGEACSMREEGPPEKGEAFAPHFNQAEWWSRGKIVILVTIICMIIFTFLSVSFFSGEINNLENVKSELMAFQQHIETLPEPGKIWEHKEELAGKIDNIPPFLSAKRPYISSLIKEISYILPKNCFLNRLHIFNSPEGSSDQGVSLAIEATLVNDAPYERTDLSDIIQSIEASPLFTQARVGYHDRSSLFNYRTIDFQLDFSLE